MPATIAIAIDDREVLDLFERLRNRAADTAPVMRVIGETIRTSVERNFASGGRPKWRPSRRVLAEGGETLSLTGRLRRSLTVEAGSGWTAVGTNVAYAAVHQFGGKTAPRIIEPKRKKALKTPYGIFRRVRHPGSRIPARPFLAVQDEDWAEISALVNTYFIGGRL